MAVVYHEIYLPIDTESTFDYIVIKQGDAGTHRVRATLISNNRVYTIPTSGVSYYMKFRKPDNNYVLVQATVADNTISAEVTEEMLRVSGTGRGEFMIVSGSDELKTATFHVKIVKETFTSGDVQSHSDFAPFAALLQGAGAAASNANTAAAAAAAAASLAEQKAQAIPDDYSDLVAEVEEVKADLDALEPGLSEDAKTALLNCFAHVAWIDADSQSYYSALANELFPSADSITAVFSQGQNKIYDTDTLNDLKQYLTVTALYADGRTREVDDYTLSGVLAHGSSTITVTKDGKTATFTVQVDYLTYTWNHTDGSPIDNGMLVYANSGNAEMTANGYSIAATNASDASYRLYYPWTNLDAEYTKVIVELDFILDGWGSYNKAPYMNGIRLSPGFGNRGGNTINNPAFVFNTSGVTSWHPTDGNQYNQAVLNAYSFTVGNEYTIKLDVDTQSTKIYVNDVLVAEETPTYYSDLTRSTLFGVSRGASITIKSYKEQRGIS